MNKVLIYLLPAIIPLLLYFISFVYANRKAIKYGTQRPSFVSNELYKAFVFSVVIAIACFFVFIFFNFYNLKNGTYIPARIENGELIKGHN